MIESITIDDIATYKTPVKLDELSQFNFLFGSNGTGKTTVGRVIAEEDNFPKCTVTWKGGTKLQPMVYNHDFIDRNFNQIKELKGVFTLGEQQAEILAQITSKKTELDEISRQQSTLSQTLQGSDGTSGKKGELADLENNLKDKCWIQKKKHDAKFKEAFEGYRKEAEKFKSKVLQIYDLNASTFLSQTELESKAESIFASTPTSETPISAVDLSTLINHEKNKILRKKVIGKEDVDIAAMINKLGNSDWVLQGKTFYEINNNRCPFCQQSTNELFAQSLNEYFDETFVAESKEIDELVTNYATDAQRIQQQFDAIISSPSRFLDVEGLKAEKALLDSKITINNQLLEKKKKESSQIITLEPHSNIKTAIDTLILTANSKISAHNTMVANYEKERETLKAQIWEFIRQELKEELDTYKKEKVSLDKTITSLETQIKAATERYQIKTKEIEALEKQTTSIQPTIDGINSLLSSFGFQSFKLAKAANGKSYKLVRQDGTDAKPTLSEGEKTFVTFLYFYYLLKGSESDSGVTTDRVVVFDDPVSSLDSDILFIVSSLIRELFEDIRSDKGNIKQIFILTHNVYFHKEITFNRKRKKDSKLKEETFWVVRKSDTSSLIEPYSSNPIKTSYELLWAELKRQDHSSLSIQNTLRRILENYFKIFGGIDLYQICDRFDGNNKIICKSLLSWVNDGSHYVNDDLVVSTENSAIGTYLRVFKEIFEKQGHLAHYQMMMGNDDLRTEAPL